MRLSPALAKFSLGHIWCQRLLPLALQLYVRSPGIVSIRHAENFTRHACAKLFRRLKETKGLSFDVAERLVNVDAVRETVKDLTTIHLEKLK